MYNKDILNKKILLVGGVGSAFDLIDLAHRNHVFIGVADYNKNTSVKKAADTAYDIDVTDIDAVVQLVKNEKYDGIISNFSDMLSPYVTRMSDKLGFHVPFTVDQLRMSTDKQFFKDTCMQYNVNVPKEFKINVNDKASWDSVDLPVIVKPVDGSGSKGITVCNTRKELIKGYQNAIDKSRSGRAIIEQYIPYDEINVTYIAQNGNIQLAAIHDRYFNTQQDDVVRVPDMYIYPSRYTDMYIDKYNKNVIHMLEGIGIKNGSLFMQACVKNDVVYFYEAGMRLNGCKTYDILEVENDFNSFERLLRFSLTGDMGEYCIFTPKMKKWYATWNVVARPGAVIDHFQGLEELNSYPWVISTNIRYKEGDQIPADSKGTLIQLLGRFHLWADTKEQLIDRIDIMQSLFKAIDVEGNDALMTPHDINDLKEKIDYDIK